MVHLDKDKEAKKREIVQRVQSRCKHKRQGVLSGEAQDIFMCWDCGKIFYGEDI